MTRRKVLGLVAMMPGWSLIMSGVYWMTFTVLGTGARGLCVVLGLAVALMAATALFEWGRDQWRKDR